MARTDAATWAIICWTPLFLGMLFALAFASSRFHWSRLRQAGIAATAILLMVAGLAAAMWLGGRP